MITELTVENLAIIDRVQVQLGPGFTVVTGETGAGKSLLVDALELAFGSRADSDLVRVGAPKLSVHLVLDLLHKPEVLAALSEEGIEADDGQVIVQRDVFAEGRSQGRINGKVATAQALRRLGELTVDLHGQHAHQSLYRQEEHLGLLDAWLPKSAELLFEKLQLHLTDYQLARRRLDQLRQSERDRSHRLDMLRFQTQEIDEAGLQVGERTNLESELVRLRHADRIRGSVETAILELLADEGSAYDRMAEGVRRIADAEALDPTLVELADRLREQLAGLHEAAHELAAYGATLEADPGRMDAIQDRLEAIRRLSRKYGDDEEAMLAYLESAAQELAELENAEDRADLLEEKVESNRKESEEIASMLSHMRRLAAGAFEGQVSAELQAMGMQNASLIVEFRPAELSEAGNDRVELLFSANAGEPVRPLAKIASGGEASRVMLAIKTALAGRAGVPIMIFDEVDAGLGGQAAVMVAKKLEQLGEHYQVISISHLPQIASRASGHLQIFKETMGGRMMTQVRALSGEARVSEIARMIAGEELTDTAMSHAQAMLRESFSL